MFKGPRKMISRGAHCLVSALAFGQKMDVMTIFFGLHLILGKNCENWTFANMMTLKDPVLLFGSENMVTLRLTAR